MAQSDGPPPLPAPFRAALGVVASLADALRDGRGLPDRVLELPVLAVSTALQLSLRAQQQYAALTVRGDELLTQLRGGAGAERCGRGVEVRAEPVAASPESTGDPVT